MAKPIKAGDTVEIMRIGRESAFYKNNGDLIGRKVKLTWLDNSRKGSSSWKCITFEPITWESVEGLTDIFDVKIRKVK